MLEVLYYKLSSVIYASLENMELLAWPPLGREIMAPFPEQLVNWFRFMFFFLNSFYYFLGGGIIDFFIISLLFQGSSLF